METISEILRSADAPPASFEEYLDRYADKVGDLVNEYIPRGTHPDMDRYLYDPLLAYSRNGGKRHRPLICFAACLAVGGDPDRAMSAAAAIEHFHSAALIHDDIADEAELRRGEPCLHLTEGLGLAITRTIVLEHAGQIEAASREGEGTTFTICIPMASSRTLS